MVIDRVYGKLPIYPHYASSQCNQISRSTSSLVPKGQLSQLPPQGRRYLTLYIYTYSERDPELGSHNSLSTYLSLPISYRHIYINTTATYLIEGSDPHRAILTWSSERSSGGYALGEPSNDSWSVSGSRRSSLRHRRHQHEGSGKSGAHQVAPSVGPWTNSQRLTRRSRFFSKLYDWLLITGNPEISRASVPSKLFFSCFSSDVTNQKRGKIIDRAYSSLAPFWSLYDLSLRSYILLRRLFCGKLLH